MIVVLDPDKKVFSQSAALNGATELNDEIKPDRAGTWYILLSASAVDAGGTYDVNMRELTETPIG